ncbi:MAG: VWA domain-containing protein [Planctomycetes bacterium]|nr:VWA domain-containing protein [Planctomycetota bacterium]
MDFIHLEFARPALAWLALAALFALRRLGAAERGRWGFAAAGAALLLGAAGPSFLAGSNRPLRVFVVDVSASVEGSWPWVRGRIHRWEGPECLSRAAADVAVVTFAADASVEVAPCPARPRFLPETPRRGLATRATDLAAGLRLAAALLSGRPGGHVLLFSDGHATGGDSDAAALELRRAGARLDAVAIPGPALDDARVESVTAPDEVREGERFVLRATVLATAAGRARIRVRGRGAGAGGDELRELGVAEVALEPGREATVGFPLPPLADPVGEFEVSVGDTSFDDAYPENDRARVRVRRGGRARVLYVASSGAAGRTLRASLARRPALVLRDADGPIPPAGYDLVVVDDLPASRLDEAFVDALRARVEGGGGLLVLGGRSSFGPGGYAGTPFEALLPVECRPSEGVSLLVALDRSGSMGERAESRTKLDEAKAAIGSLARRLAPADRFGLLSFSDRVEPVLPLGAASAATPEAVAAALGRVSAAGPTRLLPAARAGLSALAGSATRLRHLVLVSDGQSPGDSAEAHDALARDAKGLGIGISVLATGADLPADVEARLRRLAEGSAGGQFLSASAADSLEPALRRALDGARGGLVREGRTEARWSDPPPAASLEDPPPALAGLDRTVPRPRAQVRIFAEEGLPVACEGRLGLGRVAVLTTSLDLEWASAWRSWRGLDALVDDWLRRLLAARRAEDRPEVTLEGDRFRVLCRRAPATEVRGLLHAPGGGADRVLSLREETPGTWSGGGECRESGWYQVRLEPAGGGEPEDGQAVAAEFEVPYASELRLRPPDASALARVASLGGGRLLEPTEPLPEAPRAGGRGRSDATWACAAGAVGTLFAAALASRLRKKR